MRLMQSAVIGANVRVLIGVLGGVAGRWRSNWCSVASAG